MDTMTEPEIATREHNHKLTVMKEFGLDNFQSKEFKYEQLAKMVYEIKAELCSYQNTGYDKRFIDQWYNFKAVKKIADLLNFDEKIFDLELVATLIERMIDKYENSLWEK